MKTTRVFLALVLLVLGNSVCSAQQDSYNLKKAKEAIENKEFSKAKEYLQKELAANPKNGYAWLEASVVYAVEENIDSIFASLDNSLKLIPKADEESLVKAYRMKVKLLTLAEQNDMIPAVFAEAVKRMPKNNSLLEMRGEYHFKTRQYDLARKDYLKVLQSDPHNPQLMMNIGVTYVRQEKYKEAIDWYEKALDADDNFDDARLGRLFANFYGTGNFEAAVGEMIGLVERGADVDMSVLQMLADSVPSRNILHDKIKALEAAGKGNADWSVVLAQLYEYEGLYEDAIEAYKKTFGKNRYAGLAVDISRGYLHLSRYDEALSWANTALQVARDSLVSVDGILESRGTIYLDKGDYDLAVADFTQSMQDGTPAATALFKRAMAYIRQNKKEEALKDLTASIDHVDSGLQRVYVWRGWLYHELGKENEAMGDFIRAVEEDSIGTPTEATFISQHFLGIDRTARENVAKSLKEDGTYASRFMAACFHALLEDKPMAVHCLEQAIEKGYNSWADLRDHPWLKSLKGYADYETLVKKYLP